MGNFGVNRMVAKALVRVITLSGKRRQVKLNDVTEISDFYPTKLLKKRQNINLKKIQRVVMNQISSSTVLTKHKTNEKPISN